MKVLIDDLMTFFDLPTLAYLGCFFGIVALIILIIRR